jgi:hypothetical protein
VPEASSFRLPSLALLALALAGALAGCSTDLSSFSAAELNPFKGADPLRQADYNYFYGRDQRTSGPVTAADLVSPDGRCAFEPAPAMAAGPPAGPPPGAPAPEAADPAAQPINPRSNQALYFTAGPQAGGAAGPQAAMPPEVRNGPRGISLSMTECQVVGIAGYTDRVEIGSGDRGERTVKLTYLTGERPGIYVFKSGRLVTMERVDEPAPKKPVKPVKPAKTAKVAKKKAP